MPATPSDCLHLRRLAEAVRAYRELVDQEDAEPAPLADVAALQLARAEVALAAERFALESKVDLSRR